MFIDASAIVAIIASEPEKEDFELLLKGAPTVLTSALTLYEAALALSRIQSATLQSSQKYLDEFVGMTDASIVSIDLDVGREAILAFDRFGKGRHRAALNMGDCFSYACAKVHHVSLLCKGDDFVHTDVRLA